MAVHWAYEELCRLLYMCTATRGQCHGQTTKALQIIKDTNVWNNFWFGFIVTFSYGQSNLQLYGGWGWPCFDHTPVLLMLFASSIIWDKKSTHHKRINISSSPVSADSSTAADVSSLGVVVLGGVDGKMWSSGADAPVWFTRVFSAAELSEEVSSDSASVGVSSPWTRKPESARDKIITSSHRRYSGFLKSSLTSLAFGVPQGSVLVPFQFLSCCFCSLFCTFWHF